MDLEQHSPCLREASATKKTFFFDRITGWTRYSPTWNIFLFILLSCQEKGSMRIVGKGNDSERQYCEGTIA